MITQRIRSSRESGSRAYHTRFDTVAYVQASRRDELVLFCAPYRNPTDIGGLQREDIFGGTTVIGPAGETNKNDDETIEKRSHLQEGGRGGQTTTWTREKQSAGKGEMEFRNL